MNGHRAFLGFIVYMAFTHMVERKVAGADDNTSFTRKEYAQFINDMMSKRRDELTALANGEDSQVSLNASWAIVAKALPGEGDEAITLSSAVKEFSQRLRKQIPLAPLWLLNSVSDHSRIAGNSIGFKAELAATRTVGGIATYDNPKSQASERRLKSTILNRRKWMDIESDSAIGIAQSTAPEGNQAYFAYNFVEKEEVGILFTYTQTDLGSYVQGSDFHGMRWVQRTLHRETNHSWIDENRHVRAEVIVADDIAYLFALSENELTIEGFQAKSGSPCFRLNSLFFANRSVDR